MKDISEITLLIDFYGKLLTPKKNLYLDLYFFKDLTLVEIAKQENVSKNAIFDSVNKSINELREYENKLNFINRYKKRLIIYENILDLDLKKILLKSEIYK